MSIANRTRDHLKKIFGRAKDFQETFATPQGERTLGHILNKTGYYGTSYIDGNTGGTSFQEGQRWVAIYILSMMNMDPEEARKRASLAAKADERDANDLYEE